jgi:APA family basic amino acid/polyamine antiporter
MSSEPETLGRRTIGPAGLFSVVYSTSAAAVYFALGLVSGKALGLTPVVFAVGGLFLGLAAMSYVEGSLRYPEAGGSSMFASHAFNELVSFAAGWAVVLDFLLVMALSAVAAAGYAGTIWAPLGHGIGRLIVAGCVIAVAGYGAWRRGTVWLRGRLLIAIADVGIQLVLIVLGVFLVFDPSAIASTVDLGTLPTWSNTVYALTLVTTAFVGIESASSLSSEIHLPRSSTNRLLTIGLLGIVVLQVGAAAIGLSALPVVAGHTELGGRWLEAPLVGVARAIDPGGIGKALGVAVAVSALAALTAAASSAMLGVSRLAYSLARRRQIPRIVGRLSKSYSTPWLIILLAALAAFGLAIPGDLAFLAGTYAFGAMIAISITHLSVLRFRRADTARPNHWVVPGTVSIFSRDVAVFPILGAVGSIAGFVALLAEHPWARIVGGGWLVGGVVLYLIYRRLTGNPVFASVQVSQRALVYEDEAASYGALLVAILGTELDDDIVQTAGRLAGRRKDDLDEEGATIEAIWFHEIPMSLPIDAPLAKEQTDLASSALRRAKAIGEEYQGVSVSTAQVRTRKIGEGIVREARRRGAEAIVLAAEESGRADRRSAGGRKAGIGEITLHVLRKAHCRVVLTAPETPSGSDTVVDDRIV